MVYRRAAWDRQTSKTISARAREPGVAISTQRNIDELFRAVNGLRILQGADPSAVARAQKFNAGLNAANQIVTVGDPGHPIPGEAPGTLFRTTQLSYTFPFHVNATGQAAFAGGGGSFQISAQVVIRNRFSIVGFTLEVEVETPATTASGNLGLRIVPTEGLFLVIGGFEILSASLPQPQSFTHGVLRSFPALVVVGQETGQKPSSFVPGTLFFRLGNLNNDVRIRGTLNVLEEVPVGG